MTSKQLLSEAFDELTLDEGNIIDGGNAFTNMVQTIISGTLIALQKDLSGSVGNCVTVARNFFSPTVTTPTTGVGCTKR